MLWIVSHCKTQSKREDYMAELSKYIKVDVFGKCGNFIPKCGSHKDYSCTNSMMEGYKFYFAAENSICKEYFTGNNVYNVVIVYAICIHLKQILAYFTD